MRDPFSEHKLTETYAQRKARREPVSTALIAIVKAKRRGEAYGYDERVVKLCSGNVKHPPEVYQAFIDLWATGMEYSALGPLIGVNTKTCDRFRRLIGLPQRQRGRKTNEKHFGYTFKLPQSLYDAAHFRAVHARKTLPEYIRGLIADDLARSREGA